MCTHLHVDHVGWNTKLENGRWVPTFPNAKYLFAKREYAHWENEHKTQGKETNGGSFDDSVLPVVEAGKAVMIDSDHQPDPMLTIKDYPGHTPGSIAINLKDGGKQACFSGDIMHHPIQVYHPDWSSQFCSDQELSAKSRRKLLEDCVESNALLCPAHFPGANAGYIKPAGQRLQDRMGCIRREMTEGTRRRRRPVRQGGDRLGRRRRGRRHRQRPRGGDPAGARRHQGRGLRPRQEAGRSAPSR